MTRINSRTIKLSLTLAAAVAAPLTAQVQQAATAGTMTLANIPVDARNAFERSLDAYHVWDNATAAEYAARAIAADSTFGLARVYLAFFRGGPTAAAEAQRGVADAARRPAGELSFAVAGRFAGANRASLLLATRTILPNDKRIAIEYANALAGRARLDTLRALNARFPDLEGTRINLAFLLTTAVFPVPSQAAFDEALAVAQEAVRMSPNSTGAHTVLGQVYERVGRHAEALPHLRQATRLNPKNEYPHALMSEIAMRDGQPALARTYLDSAIAGSPHLGRRIDYREARAMMLVHLGRPVREALDELASAARDAEADSARGAAAGVHSTMALVAAGARDVAGTNAHLAQARRLGLAAATLADVEVITFSITRQADSARRALADYVRLAANQAAGVREQNVHRMTGLTLLAEGKSAEALTELGQGGPNPYVQLGMIEAHLLAGNRRQADSVRTAVLARKDVSWVTTAIPIIKYRAANPR